MGSLDEWGGRHIEEGAEVTPGVDQRPGPPYLLITEVVHLRLRDDKRGARLPTKSEKQNYLRLLKKWYEEMGYQVSDRSEGKGDHYKLSRFRSLP